jgi:hypothetical protein
MNSTINRDYDDILRRALHAAADSVEPSADGLERIRARLGPQPLLSFASAAAWYYEAATRITAWVAPVLRAVVDAFWWTIDRYRPADNGPGQPGPRFGWLRPMAAMGTAIFVVAAGAFAIMTLPQAISPSGSNFDLFPWTHHGGSSSATGSSKVDGNGSSPFTPGASSPGAPGGVVPLPSPASSNCSALGTSRTGSATPAPTISESTKPSATASSTPTSPPATSPTPTPDTTPTSPTTSPTVITSPTDSTTPDPGTVGTPSPPASPAAAGAAANGDAVAKPYTADGAFMRPSRSLSPAPFPCASASPKKKAQTTAPPFSAGGITGFGITERGDAGPAFTAGEPTRNY